MFKRSGEAAGEPAESVAGRAEAPVAERAPEEVREAVRSTYARLAVEGVAGKSCCSKKRCCGGPKKGETAEYAKQLGYSAEDIALGDGANLGLGCGNPTAIASLKKGEVVLDLGSGPGFDCFLAAQRVGDTGRVIGLDMTEEMIARARANAEHRSITNVEFVHGTMEAMPIPDASVDAVISNCVINLSPDKMQVLREVARVLKPGGRFAVSDVIATREIPQHIRENLALYTGCMAGAIPVEKLRGMMADAGLGDVQIDVKEDSRAYIGHWAPGSSAEDFVASAYITAHKPALELREAVEEGDGRAPSPVLV